ncbi:hypothetical protein JCM10449v2_006440 [Rhodotorula kratochvilovae]
MAYKLPSSALYAFQLPPDLVAALQPRQLVIPEHHPLHPAHRIQDTAQEEQETAPTQRQPGGAYTCALTGASFPTLDGLKQHYRTDWYRYNAKLRLEGKKTPVSEDNFNRLVENLTDSISGSDSSSASSSASDFASCSSSSDGESGTALSRVLRKAHLARADAASAAQDDAGDEGDVLSGPRTPLQWFEAPTYAPETQYGVARAALPAAGGRKRALPGAEEGADVLQELRALQLPELAKGAEEDEERKWTLLMFGGGHFAGMVVQLRPKLVSRGKGKEKEREVVILQKKTFHRYTTRRKQGGSQGANDQANGKAKSAGAMIRRHNEAALNDEVRALLQSWSDEIRSSELVFLRCSKNNYRTFFGYADDAPLEKGDPRIRGFGFPTKRPTINELVRAFVELTRVKTSHLSAAALAALDASYLSSLAPRPTPAAPAAPAAEKKPAVPAAPKLSKADLLERDRWTRLLDMVRKGRLDALRSFLDKYGPELESGLPNAGQLPEWIDTRERERTPTLLHAASAADQPPVVRFLLSPPPSGAGADPTQQSAQGRTAYELAPSRATRNEFRFAAFERPEACDWVQRARVPSGLDERVEREKERREDERREKARVREAEREALAAQERAAREAEVARVREAQERARAAERPPVKAGPQRLGGGPPAPIQERQRQGLSEEQKRRIEREERARAAEARLKRLGG